MTDQKEFTLDADELYVTLDIIEFYLETAKDMARLANDVPIEDIADIEQHLQYVESIKNKMIDYVNSQTEEV